MSRAEISFGKFVEDASPILVDDKEVGYIERVMGCDWSAYDASTSRSTKSFERVSGYSVIMWDERADSDSLGEFDHLRDARAAARKIIRAIPDLEVSKVLEIGKVQP